jgi:hypothetical protein
MPLPDPHTWARAKVADMVRRLLLMLERGLRL